MGSGGVLDHFPIHLEIYGIINKPRAPFKFNSSWLNDISYTSLVTDFWKTHPLDRNKHITEGFMAKLKELKKISKIWAHNKRYDEEHRVNEIEKEIANLEENSKGTFPSLELRDKLVEKIALRGKILKDKEEMPRLRSRAIWLREWDENTNFYHKFTNERRAYNTI